MPPPLEELLSRTLLPTETDPRYSRDTVEEDVPVCGPEDTRARRVLVDPDRAAVYFPSLEEISAESTFLNVDDSLYRRIMTATGGLRYEREGRGPGGTPVPMGTGVAHLCRSEEPASGDDYELYVADNAIINSTPDNPPMLMRVPIPFRFEEIRALVNSGVLSEDHYRVVADDHTRIDLIREDVVLTDLIAFVERPDSPFTDERRPVIAAALRAFQNDLPHRGMEMQREMQGEMRTMQRWMIGSMLLTTYLMARQMGMTSRIDSFAGNFLRTTAATPGHLWRRDFGPLWRQWRGLFERRSPVVTDLTERMRTLDVPLTEGARAILEGFDRGELPHVIFGGPSGSGKGHSVGAAFAAIVQGRSGVEAFEGVDMAASKISVGAIVEEAGSWLNGGETIFLRALRALRDRPRIIQVTEADQLASCGMGAGNERLNLLPRLYTILEEPEYRNLFFVFESTRWQTIEANGPDLLRRTDFAEVSPMLPQEVRLALDTGISLRRSGAGGGRVSPQRYNRFTFSSAALDAITALGDYERGSPPSIHLTVMDGVMAEFARRHRTGAGTTEIGVEDVVRFVARRRNSPEDQVRTELRSLLRGGIENNQRIQARIVEAFYRAYPAPRRGFLNPLRPNTESAMDAHGNRLPPGAYASPLEAVGDGSGGPYRSASHGRQMQPRTAGPVAETAPGPALTIETEAGPEPAPEPAPGPAPVDPSDSPPPPPEARVPAAEFTVDHFAEEVRSRYPDLSNERYDVIVEAIAEEAFEDWRGADSPLESLGSLRLPSEAYLEASVSRLVRSLEARRSAQAAALRDAIYREGADRGRRSERGGADDLPEAFREAGRRAFEVSARR